MGNSTLLDDDRDIIRLCILESIENLSINPKTIITTVEINALVCAELNFSKPSDSLKGMTQNILLRFEELKALKRSSPLRAKTIIWEETKEFEKVLQYSKLNISSFSRIKNKKISSDKLNITVMVDKYLNIIRSFVGKEFTKTEILDLAIKDPNISIYTFKTYFYRRIIPMGFLKRVSEGKYKKTEKFYEYFIKSLPVTVNKDEKEKTTKTLSDSINVEVEEFNPSEFEDLSLDEKLGLLNLSAEEIGLIILRSLNNTSELTEEILKLNKTIVDLKEDSESNIHEGKLSVSLQSDVNLLKQQISALEKEKERLTQPHGRMLNLKKSLDNETSEKNELKEEIKRYKKRDQERFKHIESLNTKVESLKSELKESKETVSNLTFTLEQSQTKLKKKEKKETINFSSFTELEKVRDSFKRA
jgi:ParB-like chromosome segregation protein Spo0J